MRHRVTIRGEGTEIRGYCTPDALRALAKDVADPYIVVASVAEEDFDPFQDDPEVLKFKLRENVAWRLMHFWPEILDNPPTEQEKHFIGEYFLAVQSGRGTSESEYYAEKDGVDVKAWKAKMEAAIKEAS